MKIIKNELYSKDLIKGITTSVPTVETLEWIKVCQNGTFGLTPCRKAWWPEFWTTVA
jgi:hypothetical protein